MLAPSFTELLVILGIALVIFGGAKLPQVGDGLGRAIKNFKKGVSDDQDQSSPAQAAPQEKLEDKQGANQAKS